MLRYEWNDLEGPIKTLDNALELCPKRGNIDTLLNCDAAKAYVGMASGNLDEALELIHAVEQAASKRMLTPGSDNWFSACKMRILLGKIDIASAQRLAIQRHLTRGHHASIFVDVELLAYACLLNTRGQTNEAIELIDRLCQEGEAGGG